MQDSFRGGCDCALAWQACGSGIVSRSRKVDGDFVKVVGELFGHFVGYVELGIGGVWYCIFDNYVNLFQPISFLIESSKKE